MTGTGTQADPYLVDNITNFRSACSTAYTYVKVMADLDCNKEGYLEWETLSVTCYEVDFNGHALINPLVANGSIMFSSSVDSLFKNGQILNIYENKANMISNRVTFVNMSVSAVLNKTTGIPFSNITAEKCNFVINNQNLNNYAWFAVAESKNGINSFKDCRFELNGNITAVTTSLFNTWNNAYTTNLIADGCRFEGKIKLNTGTASKPYLLNGRIINSVVALNTLECTGNNSVLANADNTNIYQSDISGLKSHSSAIPCTSEQILDPDYLNSIGFAVAEVTP